MTPERRGKDSPQPTDQPATLHPLDKGALLKQLIDTKGRGTTSDQEGLASAPASRLPAETQPQ